MRQNRKIDILYVGSVCSERLITSILDQGLGVPNLAAQKYHRLMAEGMAYNRDIFNVKVVGIPEYSMSRKSFFFNTQRETSNGVLYEYAPIILLPILKNIIVTFYLLYKIIAWKHVKSPNNKILVFDILNFKISIVSLFASFLFSINTVAIVTDLPRMMYILQDKITILNKATYKLQEFFLKYVSGYVFLTAAMNNAINKTNKPYCIIEGLAEYSPSNSNNSHLSDKSNGIRIFHYSGGLYEKFGVKMLIEAFMQLTDINTRLHLFGNGDLVDYIKSCQIVDPRIRFFGYKNNRVVLNDQQSAFVLLNPRFSDGEYNQYSFPSKTIEYMSSGIPLLTTKLKGIPDEYFEFVYLFEKESVEGYFDSMNDMLNKSEEELYDMGQMAKSFILLKKSNLIQVKSFYNVFGSRL